MNGMQLTLVAMPEDPTADGQKIELDYVRNVVRASSKGNVIQFSIVQDSMDKDGNIVQIGRTLRVKSLNAKKGTFEIRNTR
jgi:hypothetical protein